MPPLREFSVKFCDGGKLKKLDSGKEFEDMCIRLDTIPPEYGR